MMEAMMYLLIWLMAKSKRSLRIVGCFKSVRQLFGFHAEWKERKHIFFNWGRFLVVGKK